QRAAIEHEAVVARAASQVAHIGEAERARRAVVRTGQREGLSRVQAGERRIGRRYGVITREGLDVRERAAAGERAGLQVDRDRASLRAQVERIGIAGAVDRAAD